MARPPKEGIDFAGWDVGTLVNDNKIDELIDSQGIGAFTVYFYLCQKAYATNGYYLDWGYSLSATVARKLGRGASAEYVKNVVEMCFRCCLFDKRLFDLYGILTSKGIQRRYLAAIKERRAASIIEKYWLLENFENIPSCFKHTQNTSLPTANPSLPPEESHNSKVNESKLSTTTVSADADDNKQNDSLIDEIRRFFTDNGIKGDPDKFYAYNLIKNPTFMDWKNHAVSWGKHERVPSSKNIGFDLDEFFEAATRRNTPPT